MLAIVKQAPGPGNVSLLEMDEPSPGPHQVKLEIAACGLCGTDLHVLHDTFRNFPPVILGHEMAGRVVAEGEGVRGTTDPNARYAVLGATALVDPADPWVRSGHFILSPNRRGMGHGVHGGFCRYAIARPDQLFRLDDSVSVEDGALVEPLAAAVHAVAEQAVIRAGDTALVSGPGPIGLYCVMVLRHLGVRTLVAGTSADHARLELARELGAERTIDVGNENLENVVRTATSGHGVDLAFEVAGVGASAAACLHALRPLGQYIQVGHFGKDIALPFDLVAFKEIAVRGSVGYTEATWRRTLGLLAQGLRPSRIVTHRLPLSQWREGFEAFAEKRAAKVLFLPHES